jgi:hypothetical protein
LPVLQIAARSYTRLALRPPRTLATLSTLNELRCRRFLRVALMRSEESDVEGVVTVQPKALVETRWLLDLARSQDVLRGFVGRVARTDPKVEHDLKR